MICRPQREHSRVKKLEASPALCLLCVCRLPACLIGSQMTPPREHPPPRERPTPRDTDGEGGRRETEDPEPRRPGHVGQARQVRVTRHALRAARAPCPARSAPDSPAQALPARTPTNRTTVSSAHQRFGGVWWLSIVRSALEPDSQVVQPRGGAGKDAHTRGPAPAPGRQPNPTQPPAGWLAGSPPENNQNKSCTTVPPLLTHGMGMGMGLQG